MFTLEEYWGFKKLLRMTKKPEKMPRRLIATRAVYCVFQYHEHYVH